MCLRAQEGNLMLGYYLDPDSQITSKVLENLPPHASYRNPLIRLITHQKKDLSHSQDQEVFHFKSFNPFLMEKDWPIVILFPTGLTSILTHEPLFALLSQASHKRSEEQYAFFRLVDFISTSDLQNDSFMKSCFLINSLSSSKISEIVTSQRPPFLNIYDESFFTNSEKPSLNILSYENQKIVRKLSSMYSVPMFPLNWVQQSFDFAWILFKNNPSISVPCYLCESISRVSQLQSPISCYSYSSIESDDDYYDGHHDEFYSAFLLPGFFPSSSQLQSNQSEVSFSLFSISKPIFAFVVKKSKSNYVVESIISMHAAIIASRLISTIDKKWLEPAILEISKFSSSKSSKGARKLAPSSQVKLEPTSTPQNSQLQTFNHQPLPFSQNNSNLPLVQKNNQQPFPSSPSPNTFQSLVHDVTKKEIDETNHSLSQKVLLPQRAQSLPNFLQNHLQQGQQPNTSAFRPISTPVAPSPSASPPSMSQLFSHRASSIRFTGVVKFWKKKEGFGIPSFLLII